MRVPENFYIRINMENEKQKVVENVTQSQNSQIIYSSDDDDGMTQRERLVYMTQNRLADKLDQYRQDLLTEDQSVRSSEFVIFNIRYMYFQRETLLATYPDYEDLLLELFDLRNSLELYEYKYLFCVIEGKYFSHMLEYASTEILHYFKLKLMLLQYLTKWMFVTEKDKKEYYIMFVMMYNVPIFHQEYIQKFGEPTFLPCFAQGLLDQSGDIFDFGINSESTVKSPFLVDPPQKGIFEKFADFKEKCANICDGVHETIQEVREGQTVHHITEAVKVFGGLGQKIKSITDTVTNTFTYLHEKFSDILTGDIGSMLHTVLHLAAMLVEDYMRSFNFGICRMFQYLVAITALAGVSVHDWIVEQCANLFPEENSTVAQAGEDSLYQIFLSLIGMFVVKSVPTKDSIRGVTDLLRFYQVAKPAANDFMSVVKHILTFLPNYFTAWAQERFPRLFWGENMMNGGVANFLDEARSFVEEVSIESIMYSPEEFQRLQVLHAKGHEFQKKLGFVAEVPREFSYMLNRVVDTLDKYYTSCVATEKEESWRQTPFIIALFGSSQVGKTTIARSIAESLFPDVNPNKLCYPRNINAETWDRYIGQLVVRWDEFAQCTKLEQIPEFIDFVSSCAFAMPMASVDNPALGIKGATCKAKVGILCSNTPDVPTSTVIFCDEAYRNRLHCCIEVMVHPKYVLPGQKVKYTDDFRHLCFRVYDGKAEKGCLRTTNAYFEDVIELQAYVIDQYEKWEQKELHVKTITDNLTQRSREHARVKKMKKLGLHTQSEPIIEGPFIVEDKLTTTPEVVKKRKSFFNRSSTPEKNVAQGLVEEKTSSICNGILSGVYATFSLYQGVAGVQKLVDAYCSFRSTSRFEKVCADTDIQNKESVLIHKELRRITFTQSIAGVFGLIAASVFGFGAYKAYKGMKTGEIVTNTTEARYGERTHHQRRVRVKAQATCDQNASDIIDERIIPRLTTISVECPERSASTTTVRSMCGFPIAGKCFIVPYHLFVDLDNKLIPDNTRMSLIIGEGRPPIPMWFDKKNLYRLKNLDGSFKDAAIYDCQGATTSFRNIIKQFLVESDLQYCKSSQACLVRFDNKRVVEKQFTIAEQLQQAKVEYATADGRNQFQLCMGWAYTAGTQGGDCGSPLVLFNSKVQRKIAGFHVSARVGSSRGYAELITQEHLNQYQHLWADQVQNFPIPENLLDEPGLVQLSEDLIYHGTVVAQEAQSMSMKTDIIPSPIHATLSEPVTAPSVISPFDKRIENGTDPWTNALEGLSPSLPFEPKYMDEIIADSRRIVRTWAALKTPQGVLDVDQALNGDKRVSEYLDPMNMNSSPGIPYNRQKRHYKGAGKKFLLKQEGEKYRMEDKELIRRYEERLSEAKRAHRVESIVQGCLKDERRPLAKIPVAATRFFCTFPFEYQIIARQYFGEFVCACFEHFKDSFFAVGIDPYSQDWDDMFWDLSKFSPSGFDGDYKCYDGSLNSINMYMFMYQLMDMFYANEPNHQEAMRVRSTLIDEMIYSVIIVGNVIFSKTGCNPSGCLLTTVLNCWMNFMYMAFAYLKLAPVEYRSMKCYHENVKNKFFGDDNLNAIKPQIQSWYNLETVRVCLASYGITIKDARKTGIIKPIQPILDLEFLKNTTRREGMRHLACLSRDSINEMINWIRVSDDDKSALLDNCNTALRHMYFYGPVEFSNFYNNLDEQLFKVYKGDYTLFTYEYFDRVFWDKSSFSSIDAMCMAQSGETEQQTVTSETGLREVVGVTSGLNDIHFSEQSGVVDESTMGAKFSTKIGDVVQEPEWTASKLLGRSLRVNTSSWGVINTVGVNLFRFQPFHWALHNPKNWADLLTDFMFFKATAVVRIAVNGQKFMLGRLIAYAVPMTTYHVVDRWHAINQSASTSVEHQFLDASQNTVVELRLPFIYNKAYYQTTFQTLNLTPSTVRNNQIEPWTVYLDVFNQMNATTGGPTSINFSVFVHFEDVELKVPVTTTIIGQMLSIKASLPGWDKVVRSMLPSAVVSDALGGRMDKPTLPENPDLMVRKACGYLSNAKNIEKIQVMAIDTALQSPQEGAIFGTTEDEMQIKFLARKYTFLTTINVSNAAAAGTTYWESNVSPVPVLNANPGITPGCGLDWSRLMNSLDYRIPLLSYISLPFSFWHGSLRYKFDFVITRFHTAKFAFSIQYGTTYSLSDPVAGLDATSAYTTYFEVNSEKSCFEFEVPYISSVPYKRVPFQRSMFTSTITGAGPVVAANFLANINMADSSIGHVSLVLVNTLVAPAGVPSVIQCNVFIAGGDDFQLGGLATHNSFMPSKNGNNPTPTLPVSIPAGLSQKGPIDEKVIAQAGECTITKPEISSSMRVTSFDDVGSIQQVLKRYNFHPVACQEQLWAKAGTGYNWWAPDTSENLKVASVVNGLALGTPVTADVSQACSPLNTMFEYFSAMYRGWRGSIRFKITTSYGIVTQTNNEGAAPSSVQLFTTPRMFVTYMPEDDSGVLNGQYLGNTGTTGTNANYVWTPSADNYLTGMCVQPAVLPEILTVQGAVTSTYVANRYVSSLKSTLDLSVPVAPIHEFELPWTQPYLFTLTSNDVKYEPIDAKMCYNNLAFGATQTEQTREQVHTAARNGGTLIMVHTDAQTSPAVLVAAGDDFRFGIFMGVPNLCGNFAYVAAIPDVAWSARNYQPDEWLIKNT